MKIPNAHPKGNDLQHKEKSRRTIYKKIINENTVCAEIGVWHGLNAALILDYKPHRLHLIDPWRQQLDNDYKLEKGSWPDSKFEEAYEIAKARTKGHPNGGDRVEIHRDFSNKVVNKFADNYFDTIYIDGAHYYEAVKEDLELWYPKVKTNGYICGDDYISRDSQKYGVIRAVNEFIESHNMQIVYFDTHKTFPLPGSGQFCLKKL